MANIHPTAVVDPQANLADTCRIGPYCVIGPRVTVGEGTEVAHGCHLVGTVTLGRNNHLYPYCCLGTPPQDVSRSEEVV